MFIQLFRFIVLIVDMVFTEVTFAPIYAENIVFTLVIC